MSSTHYTNSMSDDDLDPIAPAPADAPGSVDEVSAPNADAPGPADAERFIEFLSHFQGLAGIPGLTGMAGSGPGPESDDVYNIHHLEIASLENPCRRLLLFSLSLAAASSVFRKAREGASSSLIM